MKRRFKTRRKKLNIKIVLVFIILIIYFSFSFFYRILYKNYLSKLENKIIVEDIINKSKNNYIEKDFFSKYKDPKYILKYTLNANLDTTVELEVNNYQEEIKDESINNSNLPLVYIYSTNETEK